MEDCVTGCLLGYSVLIFDDSVRQGHSLVDILHVPSECLIGSTCQQRAYNNNNHRHTCHQPISIRFFLLHSVLHSTPFTTFISIPLCPLIHQVNYNTVQNKVSEKERKEKGNHMTERERGECFKKTLLRLASVLAISIKRSHLGNFQNFR